MKNCRLMFSAFALLAIAATLSGCANSAPVKTSHQAITTSPQLVMAGFDESRDSSSMTDDQAIALAEEGPFAARNDHRLGAWPGDRIASVEYLEVRQREYLRTINGRPREFSTIRTTSIKRGVVQ